MSYPIIKVENLSKSYMISHEGKESYTALRDVIANKTKNLFNFNKKGVKTELYNGFESKDEFWALKDINFEINQGDRVGIIGRNGAGKSTLLKVLSRITEPTTGRITLNGRVASLLEVGTGFHPELTGRENIYLNGAILGMSRAEIKRKFDEIVDFAEVERFLDTPVKRYSSGMYVRLAFAVAAHLEPEILVVDEVLAVGDAEFQKKCLGKMEDVSNNEGRTVLFVSHNMSAIKQLCTLGILLQNGTIVCASTVQNTINEYLKQNGSLKSYKVNDDPTRLAQILELETYKSEYTHKQNITVKLKVKNDSNEKGIRCNVTFFDMFDQLLFFEMIELLPNSGVQTYLLTIPGGKLAPIKIKMNASMDIPGIKLIEILKESLIFEIVDFEVKIKKYGDLNVGIILSDGIWTKL
ncbi:MAG: ABC transporter ATP-binding protein [Saprospiraceae bacterium]|nr:ABC transporter ATP-binding protein [Saprospiraceae bacterium]